MIYKLFSRIPARLLPSLTLLLWVLPLVLVHSSQQSLMAHDEGIYAVQARSMLATGDWITIQWGGESGFDRTIGIQWLIALSYSIFGTTEWAVRLPSAIAWIASVLLTYRLGCSLLNARVAWLGAAIFSVIPLVAHYGRLGTQDMVLVCVELVGIWALLKAIAAPRWAAVAGWTVGMGFLIKGFMIIPATIAIVPFVLARRLFRNPWLYLGLIAGAIPPIAWLWAATQKYGSEPLQELFGKLFHLGGQTYLGAGPLYYFWNVPANGFPWVFFAIAGAWLAVRHPNWRSLVNGNKARWALLGYPILLFGELCLFGTKTHYYPLQLMPFVGLLGAIGLDHLGSLYQQRKARSLLVGLNLLAGALAIIVITLGAAIDTSVPVREWLGPEVVKGFTIGGVVAFGWLGLVMIWLMRDRIGLVKSSQYWLAMWLMTSWSALLLMQGSGLWGNYTPLLKRYLQQPDIQQAFQNPINFAVDEQPLDSGDRKLYLLLNFYTPIVGTHAPQLDGEYMWVDPQLAQRMTSKLSKSPYQVLSSFEGWKLVRRQ